MRNIFSRRYPAQYRLLLYWMVILLLSGGCTQANNEGMMEADNDLASKLEEAIEAGVGVCEIEQVIGTSALINTCRAGDRAVLTYADFAPDPDDEASFQNLPAAKDVAYWKVDHPSLAKIMGLCWYEDGSIKLFRAIVLPP